MKNCLRLVAWLGMLMLASSAEAQDVPGTSGAAQEQPKVEQVSLRVTPAQEPNPALKYSLWPDLRSLRPGNAAPFYYRALLLKRQRADAMQATLKQEQLDKMAEWLNVPLAEFPVEEVRKYVEQHQNVLNELSVATMREHCEWDLRLQELQGLEVISFLLHDFQEMRELGRLVAYKARLELAEKKYDEALVTLRMGYRISHDIGKVPLLINGLIGVAVASTMNGVTLDMISSPESPNLYWALKQLPHPLVDMRPALEFEMGMPFQMFPFLTDAETKQRSPQEWQQLMQESMTKMNALGVVAGDPNSAKSWQNQLGAAAIMIKVYPQAKQQLIASGMDAAAVEKMPVGQVLAIQATRSYRHTYQEIFKWSFVPFPESRVRMLESQERLKKEGFLGSPFNGKEVLPIASLLLPALDGVALAELRVSRRFALLENLEAIRMQTAVNQGRLPAAINQITVVPPPPNPFTGQPFGLYLDGNRAVLEEASVGVDPVRANDRRYLIELEKSVK